MPTAQVRDSEAQESGPRSRMGAVSPTGMGHARQHQLLSCQTALARHAICNLPQAGLLACPGGPFPVSLAIRIFAGGASDAAHDSLACEGQQRQGQVVAIGMMHAGGHSLCACAWAACHVTWKAAAFQPAHPFMFGGKLLKARFWGHLGVALWLCS